MGVTEEKLRELAQRIRERARGLPVPPGPLTPHPPADAEPPPEHWQETVEDDDGEEA